MAAASASVPAEASHTVPPPSDSTDSYKTISAQLVETLPNKDVRSVVVMPRQVIEIMCQYYALFRNEAELRALPSALPSREEFGFSPAFFPSLIDVTAQLGMFPMTVSVPIRGLDESFFAAKCHKQRAVRTLRDSPFDYGPLGVSTKTRKRYLIRAYSSLSLAESASEGLEKSTAVSDLYAALAMVREQHGETWLSCRLRICLQNMLQQPDKFSTNFFFLVVVGERSGGTEVVACEIGYLVADIYTSFTGAFTRNGTGSLSLEATAKLLELMNVHTWDLGMTMPYKEKALGVHLMPRRNWLKFVAERRQQHAATARGTKSSLNDSEGSPNGKDAGGSKPKADAPQPPLASILFTETQNMALMAKLSHGVQANVLSECRTLDELLASSINADRATHYTPPQPNSKAQRKKAAKKEAYVAKKLEKKRAREKNLVVK